MTRPALSTCSVLSVVHLSRASLSIILRPTSRRLRCSSLFTSQPASSRLSLCAHSAAHARLTPACTLPLGPPRLYTLHYTTLHHTTLHYTTLYSTARLRKTPWVLRLATTSSSGRSRAFRQIVGANLLLENGAITCPLSTLR